MMTLARMIGMDVPVIERFDRLEDGTAAHTEDFAQIFGLYPKDKYSKASSMDIASVIAAESDEADVAEFIRRFTFNTLIGNADTHVKNWSMTFLDRQKAALAPAYDFVSTIPYIRDKKAGLKFSRTKRFDEFTLDELAHLSARAMLPKKLVLDTARETIALFHQNWQAEKANLPLYADVIKTIEAHVKTIPL